MNKIILSQIGAGILGVCSFIAGMPDSISNQLPQFFPEKYRGYIAPLLLIAAYVVHNYGSTVKVQDAVNPPPAPPIAPMIPSQTTPTQQPKT